MSATLTSPVAPSLFELEQDLQALLDSDELVDESQRKEFEAELAESLKASVSKRDRCYQFLAHCSMQQENCDKEIARLQERRESFERAEKRMKSYLQAVIESLGLDAKGKPKKLEGNLATFSLRQTNGRVDITDEERAPADLKYVEICLSMSLFESMARASGVTWSDLKDYKVSIDKREARRRIEAGEDIPGVDLTVGGHSLVVK